MTYLITKYAYIRPTDWLRIPSLSELDQSVKILNAVYDATSNYVALTFEGAYTVDWGDGSSTENYDSGVKCEHNYDYSDFDDTSLCSRGYRQTIITVTPQEGSNLTSAIFNSTPTDISTLLATKTYYTPILEVAMAGVYFSNIKFGSSDSYTYNCLMEKFTFTGTNSLTSTEWMFAGCDALQSVNLFDTSNVTSMSSMFQTCNMLKRVPLFNTSSVTDMSLMFVNCTSLSYVPLFNTSSVLSMNQMFAGCYSLSEVPLFNTGNVTDMMGMFFGCDVLGSIPLFNTSSVTNMGGAFYSCNTLQTVPLLNVSNVQTFINISGGNSYPCFTGTNLRVGALSGTRQSIYYNDLCLGRQEVINIFNNLFDFPELLSTSGWTSTGWTGDFATGFTHTTGNTTSLTNSLAALIGTNYCIKIAISGRTSGSVNFSFGGYSGALNTNTSGSYYYLVSSSSNSLVVTPTTDFDGTISISIKVCKVIYTGGNPCSITTELLSTSGWTSTGWTGDFATGFTHTTGNTTSLTNSLAAIIGTNYELVLSISGRTSGSVNFSFGGLQTGALNTNTSGTVSINAATVDSLVVTPTTDFDGTIVLQIIEVRLTREDKKIAQNKGWLVS